MTNMKTLPLNLSILKEIQKYLSKSNLDFALLSKMDAKHLVGSVSIVLIPKKGKPLIYLNGLEINNFQSSKDYNLSSDFEILRNQLKNKSVGMNFLTTSTVMYLKIKCKKKDISSYLSILRQTKLAQELNYTKKSCAIAQKIIKSAIDEIGISLFSEQDIIKFLKIETIKADCELAFEPLAASGKNAAVPHSLPSNMKLKKGFLILDFGVKYNGYCSDISRTIYLGKPSMNEIKLYNRVLNVQKKCIKKINDIIGKNAGLLDNYARKELKEEFIHSLGHGTGLEVHEAPAIAFKSKDVLLPNSIITIEPGIYNLDKGYGIRIEDDVLVTNLGSKVLTNSLSKNLIIKPVFSKKK